MPSPTTLTPTSTLLDEHRALRATVAGILRDLGQLPRSGAAADWWEDISYRLRLLRVQLHGHFAAEESAGLLERIQQQAPEHSASCERLFREHTSLLARLDELAGEASLHVDAVRWADSMKALLADLAGHEEREDDLLMRALDSTPGAPD